MKRNSLYLAATAATALIALSAWHVMSTQYPLAIAYATSKEETLLGDIHLWRLQHLADCPVTSFEPGTPVGFVVNAYGMPHADGSKVLTLLTVLLERGCDINARAQEGPVPLHTAIMFGQADLVKFLLLNGADPSLQYQWNAVPGYTYRKSEFEGLNALELAEVLRQSDDMHDGVFDVIRTHLESS